jgi:DNA-binding transcriptional ArsR family regulator
VPAGEAGLAAGEIAERLDIPPATLTFHLKELVHAGLIQSRRQGRSISYSLCTDAIRDLVVFLTRECCQGHAELCGAVIGKKKRRRKPARR